MACALADHMPLVLCSGGEHVKVNRLAPGRSAMARSKPRLSISAAMKATLRERRPGGRADRILPLLSPLSERLLSLLPAPNRMVGLLAPGSNAIADTILGRIEYRYTNLAALGFVNAPTNSADAGTRTPISDFCVGIGYKLR